MGASPFYDFMYKSTDMKSKIALVVALISILILSCNIEHQLQGTFIQMIPKKSLNLEFRQIVFSENEFLFENSVSCLMTTIKGTGDFIIHKPFVTLNYNKSIDDYPDSSLIKPIVAKGDSIEIKIIINHNQFEGRNDVSLINYDLFINYFYKNELHHRVEELKKINEVYIFKLPNSVNNISILVGPRVLWEGRSGTFGLSYFDFTDNGSKQITIYSVQQSGYNFIKPNLKVKYRIKKTLRGLVLVDSTETIRLKKRK